MKSKGVQGDAADRLYEKLKRSVEFSHGTLTMDTLMHGINNGLYEVNVIDESLAITETLYYPGGMTATSVIAAAGDIQAMGPLLDQIDAKRKQKGIDKLFIIGRKGWGRALKKRGLKCIAYVYGVS